MRVSDVTLCPLGQSNNAIGHESQIGPCVATHRVNNCQACCVLRNDWRRHDQEMEAQTSRNRGTRTRNRINGLGNTTRGGRVHVQTVGLNAETKMDRHRAAGEIFLLTFLFIGLRRLGRSMKGECQGKDLPRDWKEQKYLPGFSAYVMLGGSGVFGS